MQADTSEETINDHDVIYAIRTISQNQMQLILVADQKSHILIGLLVIVMTVFFTTVSPLSDIDSNLRTPAFLFLAIESMALIAAMLVVMPRLSKTGASKSVDSMSNPFFFGFYTQHAQKDYVDYMTGTLVDNAIARKMLLQDIYQQGCVLKKKYHLLKTTYLLAIAGVLIPLLFATVTLYLRTVPAL